MAEPATPRFHYPPVAEYTELVQFCIDRNGSVTLQSGEKVYGTVRRGEVFKAKKGLAERLVTRGSNFSHVAATTPLGQPEEYGPKKAEAAAKAESVKEPQSGEGE